MEQPDGARADTATFDLDRFFSGLDALFAAHHGATEAHDYLQHALHEARMLADEGAELTILNELIGFERSESRHTEAIAHARSALALAERIAPDSDALATTLINAATALRAAGEHAEALERYEQALAVAERTMAATDRRLAALHNNLSLAYSDLGDRARAADALRTALAILEAASPDADTDIDVAATHTNLALVLDDLGQQRDAERHAARSLAIYRAAGLEHHPHYAAALAGAARIACSGGRFAEAVRGFRAALDLIAECYGTDTDQYAITAANLAEAEAAAAAGAATAAVAAAAAAASALPHVHTAPTSTAPPTSTPAPAPDPAARALAEPAAPTMRGLELASAYWHAVGLPLILDRYPQYRDRIAVGLVGHGSECYGFDDAISRDHDFGAGFCLWLTAEDHAEIGEALQADYERLPAAFLGLPARRTTPRASGVGRRVGVFEVGAFYESITGSREAPAADRPHEWLQFEEATLAAATNGRVFADPLGEFSQVRHGFRTMPEDVRLALIARRLGMIAQSGQYNVPRMLARGDGPAAWTAVAEFSAAVSSAVFLLNRPASVGYLPYYKWRFAALRRLRDRLGTLVPSTADDLTQILRLASAACFGGAHGVGTAQAGDDLQVAIEGVCAAVLSALWSTGLTTSREPFLEAQRAQVAAHIENDWLRSL